MDQYIGKLLDNRYEIMEQIGMGGMARVFRALDHRLNRQVAVKILREDLAEDAELRRRFHEESQAVAMLSHPNIVAVYDVSRSSDLEYIVMELIDGITLKQYMQKKGNKLNWREALHFITQIVKALGHAHSRGIIHRDIKPHNIMVLRDGSVKVADFGIARVASGGHSTLTQEALGSVHYISPEQARGSHIDARSDLYSAGVVLYEMITGRLPFEGDTPVSVAIQHINSIPLSPREIDPSIPEALEAITMKAMAPDPDNRYASADEMLSDLEEFRKNPNVNFDYNISGFQDEEEDVDKTQVLPSAAAISSLSRTGGSRREGERAPDRSRSAQPKRRREEYEDEEEPRRPNWPIIGAVAAILVFVAALLFIMFSTAFRDTLTPHGSGGETIMVPSVTGYLLTDAQAKAELLNGFTLVQGEQVESEEPAGTILRQEPDANSFVSGDKMTITVTVSSGEGEEIFMPNLVNQPRNLAISQLNNLGLNLKLDYTSSQSYHDTIPKDYVISTSPAAKEPLTEGQQVILEISLGKEANAIMPFVVGMTQEEAVKAITDAGLSVGEIKQSASDEQPAGKVWYQSITAYDEVEPGTKVDIFVSTGSGGGAGSGGAASKTFTVNLPTTLGDALHVEVVDSQEQTVFEGDYDLNLDTAVDVPVTGTGQQTYTVYINGHYYTQETVDFGA